MTSNIVKLLLLMVLSVFAVSCGDGKKTETGSENLTTSVLMKQEKSGLDESIYKVIATKAGVSDKAKNAIMTRVKAAIDTHTTVKAERDAAISKAVADNGAVAGFDEEIKAAVDAVHAIAPQVKELEKAENLGEATYKIFQNIFAAQPAQAASINDLMALVKVINAEETLANASTQETRNRKIDNLVIPTGGLGGKTVPELRADLKRAMNSDFPLPEGVVTLTLQPDSGLDQRIYDKIVEEPLRGTRTVAQLNAIMVAVRDAIAAHREPITARDQLIVDAVTAQGGANHTYSSGITTIVDTVHPHVLILEAVSNLMHDTYDAVVNTAHANLNNGHRNTLIARVVTAKALGTTRLRNDAIDAAVKEVRGLAVGAVLAGEDATLATAIKGAVATDYPFEVTTLANSGLDNAVWTVIDGCARDSEQKNNIMVAVRAVINEAVETLRNAAILAGVTAQSTVGAADIATLSGAIQTAVTNTYFAAGIPSFAQSHLDLQVYAAIRDFPGITSANKTALIGALHPNAATEVRAAMNIRPRVKGTREHALAVAVNALRLGAAEAPNLTVALIRAAESAQPADGANILTTQAASGLPAGVYEAIVGNTTGGVLVPLAITNAQMNAIMLPVLEAIKLRPRVKGSRDAALVNAVRTALNLDPAAVLAAGSDPSLWAESIKRAAEVAEPSTGAHVLVGRPPLMDQGIYDAIVGNTATGVDVNEAISNQQMNAIITAVENRVLLVRPQADKATRDGIIDGLAADGVNVIVTGGAQAVPAGANWNAAIKDALDLAIPDLAMKPADLEQDAYDYVTSCLASNKAMNDLNAALKDAIPIDNQAGRLAALNPALDAFMATVLDRTGGVVVVDPDKDDQKKGILRLFNRKHPLSVNSNFEGTVKTIKTGGFDVTITVTGDAAVAKVKEHVFLPVNMTAGLPLEDGDTIRFDSLSADKNGSIPGWFGRKNSVKSIDAAVVNFINP